MRFFFQLRQYSYLLAKQAVVQQVLAVNFPVIVNLSSN